LQFPEKLVLYGTMYIAVNINVRLKFRILKNSSTKQIFRHCAYLINYAYE